MSLWITGRVYLPAYGLANGGEDEMKGRSDSRPKARIAFIEDILESLPIGVIILDNGGKILMINHYQERISRIDREKLLGTYYHDTWKRLFDQGSYGNKYWNLINNRESFTFIFTDILPQFYDFKICGIAYGAPLSLSAGFILLHDVSDELGRDKRTLEQLANQLAESSEFLNNLVDSSPNMVFTTDTAGFIQTTNKTSERLLGYTRGDFLLKHISSVFADASKSEIILSRTGQVTKTELMCKKRNGTVFPARVRVNDIRRTDGSFKSKLFLLEDITWEKTMEDKLALSERLAIYSELMAGIAHQLNNPMVGVINFSGLLLGKIAADDPNRKVAETIYEAAKECQRLLASLMKSIHEPQSTFHDVNVGEVLDSALNATWNHESFNLAGVQLKKVIPGVIPKIKGDSLQLLEVFRNILMNAFQAMPDGGSLNIGIKAALKKKEIKVWFKDTGHGISKENLSRIFTPFFSTKKNKGAGLGLSFAFQVIRSHSGRIVVKSLENRGTTFVIVLPIHTEEGRFEYFDKS